MQNMLQQLETYYESQGILATSFTCRFQEACRGGSETFTGPKSAFVSAGYERGDLPRLLFLSLDSGSGEESPASRLPNAVRRGGENMDVNGLPKHKHWYRTHELAWHLLRQFDQSLTIERVNHYFAHTNSAKCCQNRPGRAQADATLFRNCRHYLAGEIRVLRPDVIVTQGNWAKWGMESIAEIRERIDRFACIARLDDRVLFWLHTYHPNARGGRFNAQRDRCKGWERYAKAIKDFMDGRYAEHQPTLGC